MRNIEKDMLAALAQGREWKSGNTSVSSGGEVRLHGHLIATLHGGELTIKDAGWQTVTTKSRINALLDAFSLGWSVIQRDWQWYLVRGEERHPWNRTASFTYGELDAS